MLSDNPAQPYFPPESVPLVRAAGLTEDERNLLQQIIAKGDTLRPQMELSNCYYNGEQTLENLRIAIPKELEGLRTLVGWPKVAVDPLAERMHFDGFRMHGQTDADSELVDVWHINNMDAELGLSLLDMLSLGRGYALVGSPDEPGGYPRITVESPLNISALWDARSQRPRAALQSYWEDNQRRGALMLPKRSITLVESETNSWEVANVDEHNFGEVPLVRFPNQARTHNRDGVSEINNEVRSIVDSACRTLLSLEVSRELYSVPQKILLGASKSDFINTDGTKKRAWETYITRILAIERDEEGNLPEIKQFAPYDPSVFTKLIEMYASQIAGITGVPPQYLGLYTQGNPVSAEAAQVNEHRLDSRARLRMNAQSGSMRRLGQLTVRFMHGGQLPASAARLAVDWADPAMLSAAQAADSISKQVSAGSVPATSDVVLKRLGYSALERERLADDRQAAEDRAILAELATRGRQPAGPGSGQAGAPAQPANEAASEPQPVPQP